MTTVAVIGTGNMGTPMSINLRKNGFTVKAYDPVEEKLDNLMAFGIEKCRSHEEAIDGADFVLTMLPSGVEVKEVYYCAVFPSASRGCRLIDSSTIDLADAGEIHLAAAKKGFDMLDAPVSGGTVGAANGTLTFMVGGEKSVLGASKGVFDAMGKMTIHCGKNGMGQAAKMCNNLMLGIQMASVAEGFNLAKRCGLSDRTLFEVATRSSANCFSLRTFCPIPDIVETAPSTHGYQPGFSTELMLKDMNLALNAANQENLNLEIAEAARSLYRLFNDCGNGEKDFSAIYRFIEERNQERR